MKKKGDSTVTEKDDNKSPYQNADAWPSAPIFDEANNSQVVPIKAGPYYGTVTIPLMLDEQQLHTYLEKSRLYIEKLDALDKAAKSKGVKAESRAMSDLHYYRLRDLVLDINFPTVTIDNFNGNENPPNFPAITMAIAAVLMPVVEDATQGPN